MEAQSATKYTKRDITMIVLIVLCLAFIVWMCRDLTDVFKSGFGIEASEEDIQHSMLISVAGG